MLTDVLFFRDLFQQSIIRDFIRISGFIHRFSEIVYDFFPRELWITIFWFLLKFQRLNLSSVIFWLLFSTGFLRLWNSVCKKPLKCGFLAFFSVLFCSRLQENGIFRFMKTVSVTPVPPWFSTLTVHAYLFNRRNIVQAESQRCNLKGLYTIC